MKRSILSIFGALLLLAACGGDEGRPLAWSPVAEDALDAAQKTQRATAFRAKDAMFKDLSGALMGAIRERGPAAAIDVCRGEAPAIAARIAEREKRADRPYLVPAAQCRRTRRPCGPARSSRGSGPTTRTLAATDGSLGVLLPIRLQAACLTCHGDPAAVAADVRAEIERWYPDDAAMGFAQGDLRGYFWIEVPTPAE